MDPFLTTVAVIILLALALRFGMNARMKRSIGKAVPDVSELSGRALDHDESAMFYFYGPHCRACKAMTPVVKAMSDQHKNVFAVDISEHPKLARDFGLIATPTVMTVRNGQISQISVGTLSQAKLEQLLSNDGA
jgi:thioredoxin 1